MARGRPSIYSKKVCDKICKYISTSSKGLYSICEEHDDLPSYNTIFHWLNDPEKSEFLNCYVRAREEQADFIADEIIQIADDSEKDRIIAKRNGELTEVENTEWISRSRLRVDARKWVASKLKPKKYGDKVDIVSAGQPIKVFTIELNEVTTKADGSLSKGA